MVPALLLALAFAAPATAGTLRVATYDVGMTRDGPGLLLHELESEPTTRILAAVQVIQAARPDVLLLARFDHDLDGRALDAVRGLLRAGPDGLDYPHAFHAPVNAGAPSGLDLDDDGRVMGRGDALGWGRFPGNGGMAILSRLPLDPAGARTFASLPWAALPGAALPQRPDGSPFPDATRQAALRLSSRGALGRAADPAGWRAPSSAGVAPDAAAVRRRRGLQPAAQPRRGAVLERLSRRHRPSGRPGADGRAAAGAAGAARQPQPRPVRRRRRSRCGWPGCSRIRGCGTRARRARAARRRRATA